MRMEDRAMWLRFAAKRQQMAKCAPQKRLQELAVGDLASLLVLRVEVASSTELSVFTSICNMICICWGKDLPGSGPVKTWMGGDARFGFASRFS